MFAMYILVLERVLENLNFGRHFHCSVEFPKSLKYCCRRDNRLGLFGQCNSTHLPMGDTHLGGGVGIQPFRVKDSYCKNP